MKVITHQNIVDLNIAPRTCYEWVSQMIANKNEAILPAKISMKLELGTFCNVMPSVVTAPDGVKYGGVKIVTRYPKRVPTLDSKLILFDALSGDVKAIMDAGWITAMRTGAVAVHSLNLFAKKNYKTIGVIGLGNTARATMSVLSEVNDSSFNVKLLKYKGQENLFVDRFKNCNKFKFELCDTYKQVIEGSDVIISAATYLPDDLCEDNAYKEGILIIPIHTLGFTNCDLFFDKIFADDIGHVKHFKYFDKFKYFSEVSDVVNGKSVGRENDKERIMVYNIGVAMHDVYFAANIYSMLRGSNCENIALDSPKEKFWI
ncbi:MAG: ornithine cyclodeaminase [Clostridia bacterium]|nr:ornithine cyclodeaminase [Clostridia bacterium]